MMVDVPRSASDIQFNFRHRNKRVTMSQTPGSNPPAWMVWAGRILTALPCLALLPSAGMKLSAPAEFIANFEKMGYSAASATPIGVVELLCVIIYLVPQTAVLGAILLTGYLGGAVATHVRVGEPFIAPLLLGMMVWGGLFFRDERLRKLLPLRAQA